MRLILIRHGRTAWNTARLTQGRTDIPLNDEGRLQSARIAARLRDVPITAIYSSPLKRALETAEPIAKAHHMKIIVTPLLQEQHFGDWEGLPLDELDTRYPKEMAIWRNEPLKSIAPNGEAVQGVLERNLKLMDELNEKYGKIDIIVLVGHTITIRLLMTQLLALPITDMHGIRIDNASYTELSVSPDGGAKLIAQNDTSHLVTL